MIDSEERGEAAAGFRGLAVYDFDGTLYDGDSFVDFVLYYLRQHPRSLLRVPVLAAWAFLWIIHALSGGDFKNRVVSLFRSDDLPSSVNRFWDSKNHRLFPWARATIRRTRQAGLLPVIVTASPEIIVKGALDHLDIGQKFLVGTRLAPDSVSGRYRLDGPNCKGMEKVRRLEEWCRKAEVPFVVESMTTDSVDDKPFFDIARRGYRVQDGRLQPGFPGSISSEEGVSM